MQFLDLLLLTAAVFGASVSAVPSGTLVERGSKPVPRKFLKCKPEPVPGTDRHTCIQWPEKLDCDYKDTHCLFLDTVPESINVIGTKWCVQNGNTFLFPDKVRVAIESQNHDLVNVNFGKERTMIVKSREHPQIDCQFSDWDKVRFFLSLLFFFFFLSHLLNFNPSTIPSRMFRFVPTIPRTWSRKSPRPTPSATALEEAVPSFQDQLLFLFPDQDGSAHLHSATKISAPSPFKTFS